MVHALVHTPVPRQLEDAANQLLPIMFPGRVYNVWLTDGPWSKEAEEEEIAAAEAEYTFSEFIISDSDIDGEWRINVISASVFRRRTMDPNHPIHCHPQVTAIFTAKNIVSR